MMQQTLFNEHKPILEVLRPIKKKNKQKKDKK